MRALPEGLESHLAQATTNLCYCWILRRKDGLVTGYTDHDQRLEIENVECSPSTGFAAGAFEQSLGLSGDTSEIAGALDYADITEADIVAGRYDDAVIEHYLVNWKAPVERVLLSRSRIGEIAREGKAFKVELRSLSVALNQMRGRQYLADCDADLGDARCRFDLATDGFNAQASVGTGSDRRSLVIASLEDFPDQWFVHGRIRWLTGANGGTLSLVTATRRNGDMLQVTLFEPLPADPVAGDQMLMHAGCDKGFSTCRAKFQNQLNFRGFPHMPGSERALNRAAEGEEFDGGPLVL